MMKRILSLLLALLMVASMVPGGVFATDETVPDSMEELIEETVEETIPETTEAVTEPVEDVSERFEEPAEETFAPAECIAEEVLVEITADSAEVSEPAMAAAADAYDGAADVGKYVRLIPMEEGYGVDVSDDPVNGEILFFFCDEFAADTVMRITDWYWDAGTTALWYQVELYSGAFPEGDEEYPWPEPAWIVQSYDDPEAEYPPVLEFVAVEEPSVICGICGNENCVSIHFYCDICQTHDCGQAHICCSICGLYACSGSHSWCGICGGFDCGLEHEDIYLPMTEPVFPEDPVAVEGKAAIVVDRYGNPVTEEGFVLEDGRHDCLSAWSDLSMASFRWQIRYDIANDLWVDIRGAEDRGIVLTPAMIQGVMEEVGSADVRCVVENATDTRVSATIPVSVAQEPEVMSAHSARSVMLADTDISDTLKKSYVVVSYTYADGRTASATTIAEIGSGAAHSDNLVLQEIPGYVAKLEPHQYGDCAVMDYETNRLILNFPAGTLVDTTAELKVTYDPDNVTCTIMHYWQNVENDGYTLYEQETTTAYKTGEMVTNVHKEYPGLSHLLYEEAPAAADGKTVIKVYYDRRYRLMKFNLGDMAYGVDPVYARYGSDIEIGIPTRAGYTFLGWKLNGSGNVIKAEDMPTTMPAYNQTYEAQWEPSGAVNYTIVYWKENADDNDYSYWTQRNGSAMPGSTVSGSDSVAAYVTDEQYFTYNDQLTDKNVVVKGDGSTIVNVYYNRNYYTIYFKGYGKCAIEEHTHGTNCTADLICGSESHTHNADCVRTQVCSLTEHSHNADCNLQCGLPIHTEHTESCLQCTKEIHAEHSLTDGCYILTCQHTVHSLSCYGNLTELNSISIENNYLRAIQNIGTGNPESGYIYGVRSSWGYTTSYYLYYGNKWYSADSVIRGDQSLEDGSYGSWPTYYADKYEAKCSHSHTIANGCYTLSCNLAIHAEHTDADGCFKDVIHMEHTDACYDHSSHTHDEDCYNYECGAEPHQHTDSCYRACTKPEHKHTNTCTTNNSNNAIYVLTAKYEQDISALWPTYDLLVTKNEPYKTSGQVTDNKGNKFRGWSIPGVTNEAVSKRATMTADLCNTTDGYKNAEAKYSASFFYKLYYMFESFDQTSQANANERHLYDSSSQGVTEKYYDKSEDYYQETYYSSNTTFGQKDITGMTPVGVTKETTGSGQNLVIYNFLYYTRNRYTLEFYNVNRVVKSQTQIMFEQPMADYRDSNGNLLRAYEPPFPVDSSFEPGSRVFEGWYTTPDCYPGTKVDFSKLTMPNNNLTLYANWVPVQHTVTYYLTKESFERSEDIPTEMKRLVEEAKAAGKEVPENTKYYDIYTPDEVSHDHYISNPGDPMAADGYQDIHPRYGYEFVGWFYLNHEGEEVAFDPDNISVTEDLHLYGKWSSNTRCRYNVYFARAKTDLHGNLILDEAGDPVPERDEDGNLILVADTVSGSGIPGHTYTFSAKGGQDLYGPESGKNYQQGYFPLLGSHSITVDIKDTDGTGANSYIFLYLEKGASPYTVRYLEKGTNNVLYPEKVMADNKNVVVTENYVYIKGYMPDEYQKTLLVVSDEEQNVITFWYEKDEKHALYVTNYYIERLNDKLEHIGWERHSGLQNNGDIGKTYEAVAPTIDGFTLSYRYTNEYNADDKINGFTETPLPSTVSVMTDGKISGELTDNGMELNFYYTRNLYPYEFRHMLSGTATKLADSDYGMAGFNTTVVGTSKNIVVDLDGDGVMEDYQLYDPTESRKSIAIRKDGEPLDRQDQVVEGQAKVNVTTFYYVRCTQSVTISKEVADNAANSDPDKDLLYTVDLKIHAKSNYHRSTYECILPNGDKSTIEPERLAPDTLRFALKDGESITILGLPTAEYSISEQNLPIGYYDSYEPESQENGRYKLTVDDDLVVKVVNTYDPAELVITKTVDVAEEPKIPEKEIFEITVTVPEGVTGVYSYLHNGEQKAESVTDGKMKVNLKDGESARFVNLPLGTYVVTEENYSSYGYKTKVRLDGGEYREALSQSAELTRGLEKTVDFLNHFPVGDLDIRKTVTKEFLKTPWEEDTFIFTVERTTEGRPLIAGNTYKVYEGKVLVGTAKVDQYCKLTVEIPFTEEFKNGETSVSRTFTVKNLPAGTYSVTEQEDTAYRQSQRTVTGLEIPAAPVPNAIFTNELIRPKGSLYLEKLLVKADGYTGELEENIEFVFAITLQDEPPEQAAITIRYNDGTETTVNMDNGTFEVKLKAGDHVEIKDLPIGTYQIVEGTIPRYANAFAVKKNGNWVKQTPTSMGDGQLYVDVPVTKNTRSDVQCTNTFPVDKAELIIRKVVTKENDLDTLPDDVFTFTVTLEVDDVKSYTYKIYNQDGTQDGSERTAAVTDRKFSLELKAGQYAVIPNMPVCEYTVTETAGENVMDQYNTGWEIWLYKSPKDPSVAFDTSGNKDANGSGNSFKRTFAADYTDLVVFTNEYKSHRTNLTVTHSNAADPAQVFVYRVERQGTDEVYTVTVTGNGSTTIYDLPYGKYTVTQMKNWSWRYSDPSQEVTLSQNEPKELLFDDVAVINKWLDGHSDVVTNRFGFVPEGSAEG